MSSDLHKVNKMLVLAVKGQCHGQRRSGLNERDRIAHWRERYSVPTLTIKQ